MKSKTQIERQLKRKTNSELVRTIILAKKHDAWLPVAGMLSTPRRRHAALNLGEIGKKAKEGDIIVVPGKVLSGGELAKKIKICAFSFSKEALKKIKEGKGEAVTIMEEIEKNSSGKGIKIINEQNGI
ncbi:MAG TPA: 50S ribosomal protein L18e [Candidatus Nanoarchaeia archaeon]|nr:50S ribosomal protein L18e [Candidatus Nanoarchaeia archaeon]